MFICVSGVGYSTTPLPTYFYTHLRHTSKLDMQAMHPWELWIAVLQSNTECMLLTISTFLLISLIYPSSLQTYGNAHISLWAIKNSCQTAQDVICKFPQA